MIVYNEQESNIVTMVTSILNLETRIKSKLENIDTEVLKGRANKIFQLPYVTDPPVNSATFEKCNLNSIAAGLFSEIYQRLSDDIII